MTEERRFLQMGARQIRVPHGSAGSFSGWYTHVRGAMISRRLALQILVFGPRRGRIETVQSNSSKTWELT